VPSLQRAVGLPPRVPQGGIDSCLFPLQDQRLVVGILRLDAKRECAYEGDEGRNDGQHPLHRIPRTP
jgi:hypothetical protein